MTPAHTELTAENDRYTHSLFQKLKPFQEQKAIDVTAFIGQWPFRLELQATAASLSEMADRLQLEYMCVSHIASIFGFDTRTGNEALFEELSPDKRLLPIPILNPVGDAVELELDWAEQQGAKGIRILPGYHDFSLNASECRALIDKLISKQIPLHVSARLEDPRLQHPRYITKSVPFEDLADVIRHCGDLPVIISGLRAYEWAKIQEVLNEGLRLDHVFLDLWFSNGPLEATAELIKRGETDLFVYGSCTPLQVAEATAFQLATANIEESDRAKLCHGNALKLLNEGQAVKKPKHKRTS